ncbi:MAG: IS66 family insertion sequence element accessory protein TnpB [Acidobacteria bacterium]|nr:IS66 family insertion sequence element accessory protein TnpB [Acidobacteriota bacterium]
MIQLAAQMRILVAVAPIDFRCGIDGLARLCRDQLNSDPFCGALFVFRNRRASAIKILGYDGQGFWLCQKRLSSGRFGFWPTAASAHGKALDATELQVLLRGGDPGAIRTAPLWRPLEIGASAMG